MNERPILFSAPMVRAIIDGRKSQTRRVVKWPDWLLAADYDHAAAELRTAPEIALMQDGRPVKRFRCPYGQPGYGLWVRETFSGPHCMDAVPGRAAAPPSKWGRSSRIWYWADGSPQDGDWTKPKPSIHMPRWASRITLEIVGVRVERLQNISEADAIAEGIERPESPDEISAVDAYRELWLSINGSGSWAQNPFVWAVSFKKVRT